jgi:hypothetical protein
MSAADLSVALRQLVAAVLTLTFCMSSARSQTVGASIHAIDVTHLRNLINTKQAACGIAQSVWSDSPLTAGTPIKAVHLTELRSAVTQLYTSQGAAAPTYTDSTITAKSTAIKAVHFTELTADVNAATCGGGTWGETFLLKCGQPPGWYYRFHSYTITYGPPLVCSASCDTPPIAAPVNTGSVITFHISQSDFDLGDGCQVTCTGYIGVPPTVTDNPSGWTHTSGYACP